MEIGVLTAPFGDGDLEKIAEWAGRSGFTALEVACGPGSRALDPVQITREGPGEIPALLKRHGLRISSLAYYANPLDPDADRRRKVHEHLRATIDAAKTLDVGVVCTIAGMPLPGKSKRKTIEEDLPGALGPVTPRHTPLRQGVIPLRQRRLAVLADNLGLAPCPEQIDLAFRNPSLDHPRWGCRCRAHPRRLRTPDGRQHPGQPTDSHGQQHSMDTL
jgi:xylose isomerase-like TIM barrel protein